MGTTGGGTAVGGEVERGRLGADDTVEAEDFDVHRVRNDSHRPRSIRGRVEAQRTERGRESVPGELTFSPNLHLPLGEGGGEVDAEVDNDVRRG